MRGKVLFEELVADEEVLCPSNGWTHARTIPDFEARRGWRRKTNRATSMFPIEMVLARGYAVMSACYCEVSPAPEKKEPEARFQQNPFAYTGVFELWGPRDGSRTDNTTSLGACTTK